MLFLKFVKVEGVGLIIVKETFCAAIVGIVHQFITTDKLVEEIVSPFCEDSFIVKIFKIGNHLEQIETDASHDFELFDFFFEYLVDGTRM